MFFTSCPPSRNQLSSLLLIFFSFTQLIFISESIADHSSGTWRYSDQNQWRNLSGSCKGRRQSPVNIDTNSVETDWSLSLDLVNYRLPINSSSVELVNTGHNVAVTQFSHARAAAGGSALNNNLYGIVEVHWHWSVDINNGSEHAIDGRRSAAEAHLFHRNLKYKNSLEASQNPDGFATLAVLLELGKDNEALREVLHGFENKQFAAKHRLTKALALSDFLPSNIDSFYTYHGSKTTPNCEETNTWIVFKEKQTISKEQLEELTQFFSPDNSSKQLSNNRHLQQVYDRKIYQTGNAFTNKSGNISLFIASLIAFYFMNNLNAFR